MPDLYATKIENTDEERLGGDVNDKGLAFVEPWRVDGTRDWRQALTAPLLPRVGDAHQEVAGTYVVRVRPGRYGGRSAGEIPGVQTGFCFLFVEYATPQRSGRSSPPTGPESNYTDLEFDRKTVTVKWGWNPQGPPSDDDAPDNGPINDGDGVAKNYGTITAKVVVFTDLPPTADVYARLVALASVGAVNRDAITLPKILDSDWTSGSGQGGSPGTIWTLQPGEAGSVGFTRAVKVTGSGGRVWWKQEHTLSLAEDFLVRWEGKDAQGKPIASYAAIIDPWRDFGGLW